MNEKKKKKPDPVTEQTLEVPAYNPALDSAARAADDPMLTTSLPPMGQSVSDLTGKKRKKADDPPPAPTVETPALSDNPALKDIPARRKKPQ